MTSNLGRTSRAYLRCSPERGNCRLGGFRGYRFHRGYLLATPSASDDGAGEVSANNDTLVVNGAAVAIMAAGAIYRSLLLSQLPNQQGLLGEAFNVARSFATTGRIADAHRIGQGPTAHLMPVPAVIAGTVYHVLGVSTPASDAVLTTLALAFVFTSFALLFACFREAGAPAMGRLFALALLCLTPGNFMIECIWFRVWDGGISVALAATLLYVMLRTDRAAYLGVGTIAAVAALTAITFFVSPPFGVAGYCCAMLLMVERVPRRRWAQTMLIAAGMLLVVLAPWTVRNLIVLGEPIILRDNFGLEFAIANDPSLMTSVDPDHGFERLHKAIHPYKGPAGYAAMRAAGGEVAYSRQLGQRATTWAASHPQDFLTLVQRHLTQMFFPSPWMLSPFPALGPPGQQLLIHWLTSAIGLVSIGYALIALDRRYRFIAIMTLVPVMPYLIVQPTLRYRYLIVGLLTFFAFDLLARLALGMSRGRAAAPAKT